MKTYKICVISILLLVIGLSLVNCQKDDPVAKMIAERGFSISERIGKIESSKTLNYTYFGLKNTGEGVEISVRRESRLYWLKTWSETEGYQTIFDQNQNTEYLPGIVAEVPADKFSVLRYFDWEFSEGYTWPCLGIVPTKNCVEIYKLYPGT